MNKKDFIKELNKININITDDQITMLDKYYELLKEWNEKINLTNIIEYDKVYLKHFYDSLTLNKVIDLNKVNTLCDVGCGAGFPGLVLKIIFPNLNITLVDSLLKRINFINIVIDKLSLNNIIAVHARIEDYMIDHSNIYDVVTSRAVANLKKLSLMCLPLVKKNAYFIALKSNCDEEIDNSTETIKKLNGEIKEINKFLLPIENSTRTIIKIKKIKETNTKDLLKIKKNITNQNKR